MKWESIKRSFFAFIKLSLFVIFFPALGFANSQPNNLVQTLVQPEYVRGHRLHKAEGSGQTYYTFVSSGLPKSCRFAQGYLKNEVSVNIISDSNFSAPLRIQVVGLYPTPLSNSCMMAISTALTQLPPDTHSVSNNITSLSRGGQLVLDFSIPRPLPSWILEIIPKEIGGKATLPSLIEGWKLEVIAMMFILIGLRLIFGEPTLLRRTQKP